MINTVWFVVLAFMLAGYAVLDGFDLGVGTIHLFLGRNTRERSTLVDAIGPVWNGNEVWLLAAGGSMVVAFPHLYAASFSGFYLALMLVLWLLLLRGLGIEFRHQIDNDLWRHAWDLAFSISSALLALLFVWGFARLSAGAPPDAVTLLSAASLAALGIHASVDYVMHFPAIPILAAALVGTGLTDRR